MSDDVEARLTYWMNEAEILRHENRALREQFRRQYGSFTRKDVASLWAVIELAWEQIGANTRDTERCESLAARIEALLPPEPTP